MAYNAICIPDDNVVEENVRGVGEWGGTCRCPDGRRYEAGSISTMSTVLGNCRGLACVNGEMINCNKFSGAWSHRKVTCRGNRYGYVLVSHRKKACQCHTIIYAVYTFSYIN